MMSRRIPSAQRWFERDVLGSFWQSIWLGDTHVKANATARMKGPIALEKNARLTAPACVVEARDDTKVFELTEEAFDQVATKVEFRLDGALHESSYRAWNVCRGACPRQ